MTPSHLATVLAVATEVQGMSVTFKTPDRFAVYETFFGVPRRVMMSATQFENWLTGKCRQLQIAKANLTSAQTTQARMESEALPTRPALVERGRYVELLQYKGRLDYKINQRTLAKRAVEDAQQRVDDLIARIALSVDDGQPYEVTLNNLPHYFVIRRIEETEKPPRYTHTLAQYTGQISF
jgi:ribosomal 50S subunit-recycling heat shock protein